MNVNKVSSRLLVRSEYFVGLAAIFTNACSISLFLLIVVVAVYSEEEWSDEFDDFAEETAPGFQSFPEYTLKLHPANIPRNKSLY